MREKVKAAEATWITDRLPYREDGILVWVSDGAAHSDVVHPTHYTNVREGMPWMPMDKPPPPYQPPAPEADTSLEADIAYAIHWCEVGKLNMLLERVKRIADAARKVEELERTIAEMEQSYQELESERNEFARKAIKWDEYEKGCEAMVELVAETEKLGLYEQPSTDPDGVELKCTNCGIVESAPFDDGDACPLCGCSLRAVETSNENDPDGVGEGWRLINKKRDRPQRGDQFFGTRDNEWMFRGQPLANFQAEYTYRRRIEQAEMGVKKPEPAPPVDRPKDAPTSPPPPVKSEQPAKVRRECFMYRFGSSEVYQGKRAGYNPGYADEEVIYREVLPGDADAAWVDELVRLCERDMQKSGLNRCVWTYEVDIKNHLAKRGK